MDTETTNPMLSLETNVGGLKDIHGATAWVVLTQTAMAHLMPLTLEHLESGILRMVQTNGQTTQHNGLIQTAMAMVTIPQMVQLFQISSQISQQPLLILTMMAIQTIGQNWITARIVTASYWIIVPMYLVTQHLQQLVRMLYRTMDASTQTEMVERILLMLSLQTQHRLLIQMAMVGEITS